jgi:transcriptional regulator with XRE-family HTH domain
MKIIFGNKVTKRLLRCMNGDDLKKLRTEAGFTQEELAKKLGTYKQKISNWENGVSGISRLYVIAIEKVFSIKK